MAKPLRTTAPNSPAPVLTDATSLPTSRHNTLTAFRNIIENPYSPVISPLLTRNRVQSTGDGLEFFIKDAYAGILGNSPSADARAATYKQVFSWEGNSTNIPDAIVRYDDAIEIKKCEQPLAEIQLNSSAPKNKLHATDSRIARNARLAEDWIEKDLVYAIGTIPILELKRLWLIYGDCYAAMKEVYEQVPEAISLATEQTPGLTFEPTNELGRVNHIDPLDITKLRVRPMWLLQNPSRLYANLVKQTDGRQFYLLMRETKYQSFPVKDRQALELLDLPGFSNDIIDIRDPNQPEHVIKARFIKYEI